MSNVHPFPARHEALKNLLSQVLEKAPRPEDTYEMAAVVESMGYSDAQAKQQFGCADIFVLAERLWAEYLAHPPVVHADNINEQPLSVKVYQLLRSFLRGMIFALPMAVSVTSMLVLDFSLWSSQHLSLEHTTAIALATILSFLAVGGFTQSIGRRGMMHVRQGHYYVARRIVFQLVRVGYLTSCLVLGGALLANSFFRIFPWSIIMVFSFYYLFLSAIWLSVTTMYVLQKELVFTGLLVFGIFMVFILFRILGLGIILSQLIALSIVAALGILFALYYFRHAEQTMEKGIKPTLPRASMVAYTTIPFLNYGFLYFLFLFIDRVIAWSANGSYMPYPIWFRGEYELGLDLALIVLIIPMGLIEIMIEELMLVLTPAEKSHPFTAVDKLRSYIHQRYRRRLLQVTVVAIVNLAVLHLLFAYAANKNLLGLSALTNLTVRFVFRWSSLAYTFIAIALINVLLLFCLSKQDLAIRSLQQALAIGMIFGFSFSRWYSYEWAVVGLLIGSVVFAYLSYTHVKEVINKLDYNLYAAMV